MAAVSAGGISQAISKASVSAREAGMSIDELIASVSVIGETTQQSMDSVGNAMKTLLARYGNVKAGVFTSMGLNDDGETSENINDIEKVLSKLGIRMRSSATEMRSITDVLDEVAEKWDTLDDVSRGALGTAFAGTRQREQFNVLMSQWDRVKELTEESANAAGTADEKYTAYMDSMEAATKRLQNAWEGFAQSLEVSPVMKFLTNTATFFVENADKLKYILTALAAVNSAKIFNFGSSKGETGGVKGLLSNIPIFGDRIKTNNILESIDKKVGAIQGEVEKDNVTKNGGLISRIKAGFAQRKADKIAAGDKVTNLSEDEIDFIKASYDYDEDVYTEAMKVRIKNKKEAANRLAADKAMRGRAFGKTAAVAGISTLLTQLGTNKQVSGYGQTVEETAGDKALRTGVATAGAVAGAATAFIPVIGPMIAPIASSLGSVAGEGLAGLISKWFHKDELQMKQRVAEAKENLSRLDAIKSTMESNSSIMTEELTSSEDFEKLYKYTDDLYKKLFELQYEGNVDIVAAINDAYSVFKGVENITSIRDLCDEINNGNAEQRSMIKKQLELAKAQADFEELVKSQEEERNFIATTLSEGFEFSFKAGKYYIGGNDEAATKQNALLEELKGIYGLSNELGGRSTVDSAAYYKFELAEWLSPERKIKTLEDVLSIYDKAVETAQVSQNEYKKITKEIKDYIQSIKRASEEEKKLDKELIFNRSNIGFFAADIHDLTTIELKDLTMDGVVGRVVKALETQGVEVRNAAGYIKDEYQDAIEKLIKSDSKFNALQQADTKTLGQLTSAQERFSSMLEKQTGLVEKYSKSWDKWYDAAKRGELSEEIAKIVYAANPERIEQFARAWNTTREGLEKLTKEFPDLTTAIGLMSPSEVREYYSVFTDFFEDLAADSALTAENLEKLINQYPQLLKYYKNGTLSTELLGKANEEQKVAYANAMLSAELSNSGISKEFLAAIKSVSMGEANEEAARFVNLTEESAKTILEEIGSIKSLNEVLDKANTLRQNGNEAAARALEELVEQYMSYERTIEWIDPIYSMAQQGVIDKLTQEIENLNEQKDALSSVNDERQRELDLIKAKDALENARKEKKRVYRAGIGFSYESDEEAITTAQENLDKLNIEKQQEDLQYQIDQLEALKSISENLDEEKQKEANRKALEEYFGKDLANLANPQLIEKLVKGFNDNNFNFNSTTGEVKNAKGEVIGKINTVKDVEASKSEQSNTAKTALVGGKDAEGKKVSGAFEDFKEAKKGFEGMPSDKIGTKEYRTAAEKYRNAKRDLEAKLSVAESAGVDKETVEEGRSLLKGYQESEKAEWILVDNLTNPDSSLLGNHVAQGSHDVMLTTKEAADTDQFKKAQYTVVKTYDPSTGEWGDWKKITGDISKLPDNSIVMNSDFDDAYAWVKNGQLYWVADASGNIKKDGTWHQSWATGTTSTPEGLSLINELGTEAVITPGGTLTALPSKTGIVPADITRNVWALGEIAPTLVAQLSSLTQKTQTGVAGNTTYEEGQYFDNFTMNVYPAEGDDFNKILEQARAQMRLTRHNN